MCDVFVYLFIWQFTSMVKSHDKLVVTGTSF